MKYRVLVVQIHPVAPINLGMVIMATSTLDATRGGGSIPSAEAKHEWFINEPFA